MANIFRRGRAFFLPSSLPTPCLPPRQPLFAIAIDVRKLVSGETNMTAIEITVRDADGDETPNDADRKRSADTLS